MKSISSEKHLLTDKTSLPLRTRKAESRAQSADTSKACSKPRAINCPPTRVSQAACQAYAQQKKNCSYAPPMHFKHVYCIERAKLVRRISSGFCSLTFLGFSATQRLAWLDTGGQRQFVGGLAGFGVTSFLGVLDRARRILIVLTRSMLFGLRDVHFEMILLRCTTQNGVACSPIATGVLWWA